MGWPRPTRREMTDGEHSEASAERRSTRRMRPRAGDRAGAELAAERRRHGRRADHRPGFRDRGPVRSRPPPQWPARQAGQALVRKAAAPALRRGPIGRARMPRARRVRRRKREGGTSLQRNRVGRHEGGAPSQWSAKLTPLSIAARRRRVHDEFSPQLSPQSDLDASKDCIGCHSLCPTATSRTYVLALRFENVKPNIHRT